MSTFFTIGHSNRSADQFVQLLRESAITLLVDVRTIPRSRANPQFGVENLPQTLADAGIGYRRIAALGGLRSRRRGAPPSANGFWQNTSFRNYADYTATAEFKKGLNELRQLGTEHCCTIMCAEAVWWRCHRRIIADYLIAAGEPVFHIMGPGKVDAAFLNPAARPTPEGTLIYPEQ